MKIYRVLIIQTEKDADMTLKGALSVFQKRKILDFDFAARLVRTRDLTLSRGCALPLELWQKFPSPHLHHMRASAATILIDAVWTDKNIGQAVSLSYSFLGIAGQNFRLARRRCDRHKKLDCNR